MRRSTLALAACILLLGTGVAAAHADHVGVDGQYVTDEVALERVFLTDPGHVVITRGADGPVVGVRSLEEGFHFDVSVALESGWRGADGDPNTTLVATLYHDDGDGQFDADDESLAGQSFETRSEFVARASDRPASVVAFGFTDAESRGASVVVPRATLPADGHLVLHANDRTTTDPLAGRVLASRSLPTGRHTDVALVLNESWYDAADDRFVLWAVLYRDDGDGRFDAADRPLRAGDDTVATVFGVRKNDSRAVVTPSATSSPTPTPTPTLTPRPTTARPSGPATTEPTGAGAADGSTATRTAIASTDVSSPELTALFATGFVVLGALLVLTRLRR